MKILTSVLLIVALLGLGGCRDEATGPTTSDYNKAKREKVAQAQKGMKKKKARKARKGAQVGRAETGLMGVSDFVYDPTDKRDPFRSFVLEKAREAAKQEGGPLERFDVNQLTVLAVIWDTNVPRALVADPSGRGYIVSEGTRVGKNEGRITRIEDNVVMVKETYTNWLNERTTKDIQMRVHRGKGR